MKIIKAAQSRKQMRESILQDIEKSCEDISRITRSITEKLQNGAGDAIIEVFKIAPKN